MRLTLRTMLAYLDDILEASDAEELGEKINQSDYATGLVHRVRNTISRQRLSSPPVVGKGLAADANTVAEYLDNTLHVERVGEFEKICLESDMNLAEVAASHQILSLVLGTTPTDLTEEMRERVLSRVQMRGVTPEIAAPPLPNVGPSVGTGTSTNGNGSGRFRGHESYSDSARLDQEITGAAAASRHGDVAIAAGVATAGAAAGSMPRHTTSAGRNQSAGRGPLALGLVALLGGFGITTAVLLLSGYFGGGDSPREVAVNGSGEALQAAPAEAPPANFPESFPPANVQPIDTQPANSPPPTVQTLPPAASPVDANAAPAPTMNTPDIGQLPGGVATSNPIPTLPPVVDSSTAPPLSAGAGDGLTGNSAGSSTGLANDSNDADRNSEFELQDIAPVSPAPATDNSGDFPLQPPAIAANDANSTTDLAPPAGPAVGSIASGMPEPSPTSPDITNPLASPNNANSAPGTSRNDPSAAAIGSMNLEPGITATAPPSPPANDVSSDLEPPAESPAPTQPANDAAMMGGIADATSDAPNATETNNESAAPPASGANAVGANVAKGQAIAGWDADKEVWQRLSGRFSINEGVRYRGLPTFRPQFALNDGLILILDGESDFGIGESNGAGVPRIDFEHGRAIVMDGEANSQLIIGASPRQMIIQMGDANSQYALEVSNRMAPGSNPATDPVYRVARVVCMSGRIRIEQPEQPARIVEAGQAWMAIDERPARIATIEKYPEWVKGQLRSIDRVAQKELVSQVQSNDPLMDSLVTASSHRQTDVKSLASRCLASLDRHDESLEAIGSRRQHPHWSQHFQQLRKAVQQGPESALAVKEALERTKGADAPALYRMLWGYSPEQLKAGAAAELVQSLESESIEMRVLAIENLAAITGKSLYYRADRPLAQRETAIVNWQRRLKAGEITYRNPPFVLAKDDPTAGSDQAN